MAACQNCQAIVHSERSGATVQLNFELYQAGYEPINEVVENTLSASYALAYQNRLTHLRAMLKSRAPRGQPTPSPDYFRFKRGGVVVLDAGGRLVAQYAHPYERAVAYRPVPQLQLANNGPQATLGHVQQATLHFRHLVGEEVETGQISLAHLTRPQLLQWSAQYFLLHSVVPSTNQSPQKILFQKGRIASQRYPSPQFGATN